MTVDAESVTNAVTGFSDKLKKSETSEWTDEKG